ncbi:MAG: glycosyltransferase [Ruminococcaceae bacterium]|nr:glycosyltransferase [Oscillospiraceae bacterium]
MKITHVISDTNIGGAGILLSAITSELKDEFDFEIILPKGSRLIERLPCAGIKITEADMAPDNSFYLPDIRRLTRYFRSTSPDIVHTHAALSPRIAARLAGVEVCLSTRHCAKPPEGVKRLNFMQRNIYNWSTDITVSTADFATQNLIKEGKSSRRIITIRNGVRINPNQDTGSGIDIFEQLKIPRNSRLVGSVARLERIKGQDLIIRAAAKIVKDFDDVYFLFIGDGSCAEEYKHLSARLGLGERVIFTGYVSDPGIYQRHFYLNVNASRGTETSCLAISECMGLGIPTVASDFGGNTEMIEHLVNGLIFRSDDTFDIERCIRSVLISRELYSRLSKGAERIYRERYTADRMISEYRRLYRRAAALAREHRLPDFSTHNIHTRSRRI